jgi:putative DNA primase/helicase
LDHVLEALDVIPNTDAFLFEAFPGHTDPREAWIAFAHAVYGAGGRGAEDAFVEWTATYEDGPVDGAKAREGYRSCSDTYTGWPTLDRIVRDLCRPSAEDEFEADLGEAPAPPIEYPPAVRLTDEYVLDRLLPKLQDEVANIAGDWYVWDGTAWRLDQMLHFEMRVRGHLRDMAVQIDRNASFAPNKDEAKALRATAKRLQGATGIKAIMGLAAAPLSRPMEDFDVDPMALNTPAGLVDLTTGVMRKTTPQDRVTRCTGVAPTEEYDPEQAPNWSAFLDDLTGGDQTLADFLQRWMGYSITGVMTEKKLAFVWGSNSNTGKSTFVNAVNYAVGDYGKGVDVDNFTGKRGNTDSLAQLPGIRFASATEASAGQLWDDKIIKAITGGDRIEARRLYRSFFTFQPQFKMMIAGNHRPSLARVDGAMLKRIFIIPMNYKVAQEDIDFRLGMKLQDEADQILRWMIEGALAWQRDGLNPPDAVLAATDDYTEEEDTLTEWLEEQCEIGGEHYSTTSDLFTNWRQWNRTRGSSDAVGTAISFARALNAAIDEHELPINRHRTKTSRGFVGIRIRPRVALGTEEFDT